MSKHDNAVYAESFVDSIVAGLLDIPEHDGITANGRLTQAQTDNLVSCL